MKLHWSGSVPIHFSSGRTFDPFATNSYSVCVEYADGDRIALAMPPNAASETPSYWEPFAVACADALRNKKSRQDLSDPGGSDDLSPER